MILIILFLIFGLWIFHNYYWKRKDLPPGPPPLPLIGNVLSINKHGLEKFFTGLKNDYGDIHTFWFGETPVVSINDVPTILETFVKDGETYAGRPIHMLVNDMTRHGRNGLIFTDGPVWREHRRFALHVLRDFGMGKNLMQERVLDEVTTLIEGIKKQIATGKNEISIQNAIEIGVGSVINALLFGYSFTKHKPDQFYELKAYLKDFMRGVGNPLVRFCDRNPLMFKALPFLYREVTRTSNLLESFFMNQLEAHKKEINFDANIEPTDYAEAFLKRRKELEAEGIEDHTFTDKQLFGACLDLWIAGQETTTNTLSWMVIYLMLNPEVQKKVHAELDEVIASDRFVTVEDKTKLNYINAVIAETQRFCNLVPLNVNHRVVKDVEIKGYRIPANTTILHQISSVLFDERYFPEPTKFKPERFLDSDGRFSQPSSLMPFGVGKRSCLGEGLAKLELYLFTANIFNHFEMTVIPSNPPNTVRIVSGTVQPEPYLTYIKSRF
uniref:Cytochrome P450 n=1 Tax=Panagrolaimus sp. PS1159 TaxID=55785 RepID=A0AC35ET93_9BILA